ncbi:Myeloid leukemia factor 1 [Glycine soja]
MQGPGGGRDPFFDFGGFGGFGSFGPPRSLISSFFGGRDPFSDPFFAQPFGGMFESSPFGGPTGFPFPTGMNPSGFLEHPAPGLDPSGQRRGPIIQELDSDEENDDTAEKKENPRKHGRSDGEPSVEHPDDEIEGKKIRQAGNESRINIIGPQPQSHSFCFQSSTVSYGGPNGLYYTSSRTRRSGSDGVTFEERKEADSSTMQASHLISRGIHGKGHSLSRNLNSDGRVDTRQTLLNINEDELAGFEEQWKEKGQKYLPGWTASVEASGSNGQAEQARSGGWALPSSEYSHTVGTISEARDEVGSSRSQERVLRTNSSGRNAYRPGVGRRRH